MNLRKTRRGGSHSSFAGGQTPLSGGAVLTRLKKPFFGSKNPKYALPITEVQEIDKDKYKILGKVSYNLSGSDFAFFRSTEYVEKYLKSVLADMAKRRFPSAVKVMEYEFKTESVIVGEQEVIIYEGTIKKSYKTPITNLKYFVSGTVVGLVRPQNNITRSRSRSK